MILRIINSSKHSPDKKESIDFVTSLNKLNFINGLESLEGQYFRGDPFIYNKLLQRRGSWALKCFLFKNLSSENKSQYSINIFIKQCALNNDIDSAYQTYLKAKEHGLADVITYNSFITAAENSGRFE